MPILTSAFNRILVERHNATSMQGAKISSNVSVKDVVKTELSFGEGTRPALRFVFEFLVNYEPKHAKIHLEGDVIYMLPPAKIEEVLKQWKKDKTAPKDMTNEVVNHLLSRCNIEALILSRELNLPSPIPLPRMQAK